MKKYILLFLLLVSMSAPVCASNLSIDNVTFTKRSPQTQEVSFSFDITWDHSWKTKINHDAVWVVPKLFVANSNVGALHCPLSQSGTNPVGVENVSSDIAVIIPADKLGAMIIPKEFGANTSINAQGLTLTLDYQNCGLNSDDDVQLQLFGYEMVYIPESSFYAGDMGQSTAAFQQGQSDSDAWFVTSENQITADNVVSDGFYYVSANNTNEDATGAQFTIGNSFPKGFKSFYVMKYELSEGQWVDFINALDPDARLNLDVTNLTHKNSDAVIERNHIQCSGTPLVCSTSRPYRAVSFLSWRDVAAFLDWNALRPITELEFEKMSRGPELPKPGQYAWGTRDIESLQEISAGLETGSEFVINDRANAHFNDAILIGGDAPLGSQHERGPVRIGMLSGDNTDRLLSGGSYYGVMELSGNLSEFTVTVGHAAGRNYQGSHGDGQLTNKTSFEGFANQLDWPGMDVDIQNGITGADGMGLRGGNWKSTHNRLMISDRKLATFTPTTADSGYGARGAREL